jgi:5,10-methylenetetrahydrofolate reductase
MSGREPFDPANRMRPVPPSTRDTAFGSPSLTPSNISTPNAKKDMSPGSEKPNWLQNRFLPESSNQLTQSGRDVMTKTVMVAKLNSELNIIYQSKSSVF